MKGVIAAVIKSPTVTVEAERGDDVALTLAWHFFASYTLITAFSTLKRLIITSE